MANPSPERPSPDEWLFTGTRPGCWQLSHEILCNKALALCHVVRLGHPAYRMDEARDLVSRAVVALMGQMTGEDPKLVFDSTGTTFGSWRRSEDSDRGKAGDVTAFTSRDDCYNYVLGLIKFKLDDRLKRTVSESQLVPLGDHDPPAPSPSVEASLEACEDEARARSRLESFYAEKRRNAECRPVFELVAEDLSREEIGKRLGMTTGAVRAQLCRCRKWLCEFVERRPNG